MSQTTNPLLLRAQAHNWAVLKTELRERYPDLDGDDLFDTLDGAGGLIECIDRTLGSASDDEVLVAALKMEIAEMQARKARIEARAGRKRELVCEAMGEAEIPKLELPRFTVSRAWRQGGVVITDEAALPDDCIRVKREPDKTAIGARLRGGEIVPGAQLGNDKMSITVRRT